MQDFLTGLALVLVIEGVLYALFPRPMQRMIVQALSMTESQLRIAGVAAAALGVGAVWLVRG